MSTPPNPPFPDFPLRKETNIYTTTDYELKLRAYQHLTENEDICVHSTLCKYFYLLLNEWCWADMKDSWPKMEHQRKRIYLHKGCRVNQPGHHNLLSHCPSKTTATLDQWCKQDAVLDSNSEISKV